MPSARTPKPERPFDDIPDNSFTTGKATKRAKDKENDAAAAKRLGRNNEVIANLQKRSMRRHVQRKSRVKPLTRSSGSGRGNAQTRRRKDSGG